MKSEKIQEKIEFLVHKWIDDAQLETIIEYAAEKLTEFYQKLEDEVVEEMYEDAQTEPKDESRIGYITRMGLSDGFDTYQGPWYEKMNYLLGSC